LSTSMDSGSKFDPRSFLVHLARSLASSPVKNLTHPHRLSKRLFKIPVHRDVLVLFSYMPQEQRRLVYESLKQALVKMVLSYYLGAEVHVQSQLQGQAQIQAQGQSQVVNINLNISIPDGVRSGYDVDKAVLKELARWLEVVARPDTQYPLKFKEVAKKALAEIERLTPR